MSVNLLSQQELATFTLGQALEQLMTDHEAFPQRLRDQAWRLYGVLLERVLDYDQVAFVTRTTGLIDLEAQMQPVRRRRRRKTASSQQ